MIGVMKSHSHSHSHSIAMIPIRIIWTIIIMILTTSHVIIGVHSLTIAVYGGSGFLGRRICKTLIGGGHHVISISKGGRPPSYYCNNDHDNDNGDWAEQVDWRSHCIHPLNTKPLESSSSSSSEGVDVDDLTLELPPLDAAISCIGTLNPAPSFDKLTFFGLSFNDTALYSQNGLLNECAAKIARRSGAQRFVFLSVSYEIAKMLEGPLDGYMSGKRHAERKIWELFGERDAIVLGPSLIYGGKRFPKLGRSYSQLAKSALVRAYLEGMDGLRNLSTTPIEDWVERSLFSAPVDVEVVARVASAAALGKVTVDMVVPRRQGFCDFDGKPVFYDNVVFVDGTLEIERIDASLDADANIDADAAVRVARKSTNRGVVSQSEKGRGHEQEPLWEGALIGKKPYLYPLPVIAFFLAIFGAISNNQFVLHVQDASS
jgi:hypothetical protein